MEFSYPTRDLEEAACINHSLKLTPGHSFTEHMHYHNLPRLFYYRMYTPWGYPRQQEWSAGVKRKMNIDHDSRRRRSALACNTCRERRTKCDGQRPKCSFCVERNKDCFYEETQDFAPSPLVEYLIASYDTDLLSNCTLERSWSYRGYGIS